MFTGYEPCQNFIVKRIWWNLEFDESKPAGATKEIWVECEFAVSQYSSEGHKQACKRYQAKTGTLLEFEESMF